jgi:hypothetical protein
MGVHNCVTRDTASAGAVRQFSPALVRAVGARTPGGPRVQLQLLLHKGWLTRSGELAKLALRCTLLNAAGPRLRRNTGCARPIGRIQRVLCCRILGLRRHCPSRVLLHMTSHRNESVITEWIAGSVVPFGAVSPESQTSFLPQPSSVTDIRARPQSLCHWASYQSALPRTWS